MVLISTIFDLCLKVSDMLMANYEGLVLINQLFKLSKL